MTTRNRRNVLSRSLATFAAVVTLTTGIALTAAPSAAHAEVGDEFIVSDDDTAGAAGADFMDYTDDVPMVSAAPPRQAGAASSRVPRGAVAAPAGSIATPAATTSGIIMRDGGVCDPIRHMGC